MKKLLLIAALIALFSLPVMGQALVSDVAGVLTINLAQPPSGAFAGSGAPQSYKVIVSENITSIILLNPQAANIVNLIFTQNSTGGFTVVFGGNVSGTPSVSTTASATTIISLQWDLVSQTWYQVNAGTGGGGGGTPGGGAGTLQFNSAGAFGGVTRWTTNGVGNITASSGGAGLILTNVPVNGSPSGGFSLPSAAAASANPTTAALFGYDNTNNRLVLGNGTNTSFIPWFTSAPTTGHCAQFSGTLGLLVDSGAACTTTSLLFSGLTTGTNTTATMTVGTGGTLTFSGSGVLNASQLGGATFAAPGTIGGTTPAAASFSSLTDTGITGSTQCLHVNTSGLVSGTGSDCGSGGSGAFSGITSGTNTTAAMVVGTGGSLTVSGSGTINATTLGSQTFANPGPVGSGTASTGAFTTLSASSTVSGTGFTTYLASPPAIGGTAPAAGSFTTLTATTSLGVGSSPPTCGSATGIFCASEASGAGTPTTGVDYQRADSATHAFICSLNNGTESNCDPLIPASWTSGGLMGLGTWPATTAATSTNVLSLFSGTCSSSTFLRGDGTCAAASVSSLPWSSLTAPTGNLALSTAGNTTSWTVSANTPSTTNVFTFAGFQGNTGSGDLVNIASGGSTDPLLPLVVTGLNTGVVTTTVNAAAGATADVLDLNKNGVSLFAFSSGGNLTAVAGGTGGIFAKTFQSTTASSNVVFGISTSTGGFTGSNVFGTCDSTSTTGTNAACNNTIRGGDETGASGTVVGGNLLVRAGQVTSTSAVPGIIQVAGTFLAGGTTTLNSLGCVSADDTMATCGASPTNVACVFLTSAAPVECVESGEALVLSSNTAIVGDNVCAGTTAGKVTDNGTTACTLGTAIGIVKSVANKGASTTLPLVILHITN